MKSKTFLLPILGFAAAALLFSCAPKNDKEVNTDMVNISKSASGNAPAGNLPDIKFETDVHDFGNINQGQRVSYAFKFKNVGGSPLLISNATGSCGCTVPEWPKEPIQPGASGVINVEFNSEGKHDQQTKTVTLVTNCEPSTKIITIKAFVKSRPGDNESNQGGH